MHHRDHHRPEVDALLGQEVLVAGRALLVGALLEDALVDEPRRAGWRGRCGRRRGPPGSRRSGACRRRRRGSRAASSARRGPRASGRRSRSGRSRASASLRDLGTLGCIKQLWGSISATLGFVKQLISAGSRGGGGRDEAQRQPTRRRAGDQRVQSSRFALTSQEIMADLHVPGAGGGARAAAAPMTPSSLDAAAEHAERSPGDDADPDDRLAGPGARSPAAGAAMAGIDYMRAHRGRRDAAAADRGR